MHDSDLDCREEVDRKFRESCGDAAAFFKPADAALDDAMRPIRVGVELERASAMKRALVRTQGNDGPYAMRSEPSPDTRIAVPFVSRERAGNKGATAARFV